MPLDGIIRRMLVYRLMRYRSAWLIFSLLSFYLTGIIVMMIFARQQLTVAGSVTACSAQQTAADGSQQLVFQLATAPSRRFELSPGDFTPSVPASFCTARPRIMVVYETNSLGDPLRVDRLTISADAGTQQVFVDTSRSNFALVKQLQLIFMGGGMLLVSLIMLGVAVFWRRVGHLTRAKPRHQKEPEKPHPIPVEFAAQVANDIAWLDALPWGEDPEPNHEAAYDAFQRGLALVAGWNGDEERLVAGAGLLVACPPALAYAGAAEVALQLARYDLLSFAPEGIACAADYIQRALSLAPGSLDAQLIQIHVLAAAGSMGTASDLAEATNALTRVRAVAPTLPRLPSAAASVYLARRHYTPAVASLKTALKLAPSQEEAQAILDLLAQTLLKAGNLRQALRLFVKLNLDGSDEQGPHLPATQRRLRDLREQAPVVPVHADWTLDAEC